MTRIVIVGGYGAFGARVAERLAHDEHLELVIAGRSLKGAVAAADALSVTARARISHARLEAATVDSRKLRALGANIVVNASGPFQTQDYGLARAAIGARAHYIDLADARSFVTGIGTLDAAAREADVLVTSGASSVPALAAAIVDELIAGLGTVDAIRHGISPANSFNPGVATTASILGGLGKPSRVLSDGRWQIQHGWQGLTSHLFPKIGRRLMSHCDVPDLDLFPQRYPSVRTVAFAAGLEVSLFHLALWALSWPCRAGLIRNAAVLASALLAIKHRLAWLGSDKGGMFVCVEGRNAQGARLHRTAHVVAGNDQGPYIPALPSVILARKLAQDALSARGAMPCVGLFSLADFEREIGDLDIAVIRDAADQL